MKVKDRTKDLKIYNFYNSHNFTVFEDPSLIFPRFPEDDLLDKF